MPRITFPSLFEAVESVSADSQRKFLIARGTEFTLLVMAAGFGEVPRTTISDIGPWVAVVAFLLALITRLSGVGEKAEKRWYDARAAAESIKSSAWQFAVGGGAFPLSDQTATQRFRDELHKVLKVLPHLDVPAGHGNRLAVTKEMDAIRSSPRAERAATYLQDRVQDQQSWYSAKAETCRRRAAGWRWLLIGVDGSAVLLGLLRVLGLLDVNWLGVLAAAAAGIAAWQQVKNYSSLSEAYSVTSHEVAIVSETVEQADGDEEVWAEIVHNAEAAFSREHTLWLARRSGTAQ